MNESVHAADVVRRYYDALRDGEPLEPFFRRSESTVKFGITEALFGYDDVATALRKQTETTTDWRVESHTLSVDERETFATYADEVTMAWIDTERDQEYEFDSRWSGTLVATEGDRDDGIPWAFATMHVSAPPER
ncbi:nuclear transport factor 2 family protein [Natrarchaeobius oligotrophus]|uniref:DUF3225 domain-containing protein n=1 Tax=Natrarchaeobius chitinivorans TaxID=1679083 RepID=A0A3N6PPX3_NATCH|nr:nuclear transport factor 2 family protein [Natrarchaeobius chitinivorans]RQH01276.1 DUF3225 domain-containing protein [Natrarchaeobius chitinivorans]